MVDLSYNLKDEQGYMIYNSTMKEWGNTAFSLPNNAILLCTSGTATIEVNLELFELEPDTRLYLFGNLLFKVVNTSSDFSCRVFMFSRGMVLNATMGVEIELLELIFRIPCVKLENEKELSLLKKFYDIMEIYATMPELGHHYDFVCCMVRCLLLSTADSLQRIQGNGQSVTTGYSTADNYFRTFMKLLSENSRQQHDVAFYADKMHITPKYLNEICRKKTHATAKGVITGYVVALIKRELVLSGTSVQRIAYDFNFCDQSSFGKFFKKATGIAPMTFRKQYIDRKGVE